MPTCAEPKEGDSERPIPVPDVRSVSPPAPSRPICATRTRNGASTSYEPPPLAASLSVSDVTSAELAVALGAWSEPRAWDGMRRTVMHERLRAQAGESVWRQPVLQSAALLRQQAGTPVRRDMQPFHGALVHNSMPTASLSAAERGGVTLHMMASSERSDCSTVAPASMHVYKHAFCVVHMPVMHL